MCRNDDAPPEQPTRRSTSPEEIERRIARNVSTIF
jgi:hypothetical protein